jgi:antitoxin component YwqK of YwqJK toxin-antitoxin module
MRLLFIVASVFLSLPVLACQCPAEATTELNLEKYNRYDLIITGVADSIGECSHSQATFINVKTSYKGNVSGRILFTGNDCSSACGIHMVKGESYIIYAVRNSDNTYTIPHCSSSHPILTDEEIRTEEESLQNNANGVQTFSHDLEVWKQERDILEKLQKSDGYLKVTYLNGKPTANGKMENGIPTGKWTYYFPDGHLESSGHYVNGKKEGAWTEYTYVIQEYTAATQHIKTHLVHNYGTYLNGLKDGKWHKINDDGTVHTFYYKQGKLINQID